MVLIKHNYLKSEIFFNPIFIPGFSGSRFFMVQVFRVQVFRVRVQGPGSGFRIRVQVIEVAVIMYLFSKSLRNIFEEVHLKKK